MKHIAGNAIRRRNATNSWNSINNMNVFIAKLNLLNISNRNRRNAGIITTLKLPRGMTDLLRNNRINSMMILPGALKPLQFLNHFYIIVELVEIAEGFLSETLSSGKLFFEDSELWKRFP